MNNLMNQLKLTFLVSGVVLAVFLGLTLKIHSLQNQLIDTRIERDSIAGEHAELKKYNDSTWMRMAIIQHVVKDLQGQLTSKPKVVTKIEVKFKTAETDSQGEQHADQSGTRVVTGTMDSPPIHVAASVTLRDTTTPPAWHWSSRLDPLTISLDVTCKPVPTTHAQVPVWAEVQKIETRLDKNVCPESYQAKKGWRLPWWMVPVAAGAGYLLGKG